MPDEMLSQFIAHLFSTYGPIAFPVVGLLLVIKYLLDKDKERELTHKDEKKVLRDENAVLQKEKEALMMELLKEARGNADLASDVRDILKTLTPKGA